MLDSLLVLGQVPGTNFQITFNELLAAICVCYLLHEYLKYAIEIERWFKWLFYRIGVNYRCRKRQLKSYIKYKRYRLAIFERRLIRQAKMYLRRRRHALYMASIYRPQSSLKRQYYIKLVQIERKIRRVKRSRAFQSYLSIKDFVSQSV